MQLPASSDSLLQNATAHHLYADLVKQLNKDFGLANLSYEFPLDCSPEDLKIGLAQVLQKLLQSDYDGYLNFVYRVDIPEKDLLGLQNESLEELSEQLTYIFLRRIYKKVWFRSRL